MAHEILWGGLAVLVFGAVIVASFAVAGGGGEAADKQVAETVLALERAALDRWGNGDPDGYLEISAPQVTYFDPTQKQRLDGLPALGELYETVRSIADDLSASSRALREGEGTIGKLVHDDELYEELRRALATLTGTLEEAREAAPITTLLNSLFLGF